MGRNQGRGWRRVVLVAAVACLFSGCYVLRTSSGGGQTEFSPPRPLAPADIAVPAGYRVELVATDLDFPTGIAFDEAGTAYVTESGYSYGEVFFRPRLVRIVDGRREVVLEGGNNGPWNGLCFHEGAFYIAEGGVMEGGRILRVRPSGEVTVLIEDLPSMGDHHVNGPVAGPDGAIYFGLGTATNSGVVGEDNVKMGWPERWPDFHDLLGQDLVVTAEAFGPSGEKGERGVAGPTAAFAPLGHQRTAAEALPGATLAAGSIIRLPPNGGPPEQVAWGLRNPFGLAFSPTGELFATDNGYDNRGRRPVWGAADFLWRIEEGLWYGFPDFSGGRPLTDDWFRPPGGEALTFLLTEHPNPPPVPAARLAVHSSSNGFDFSRSDVFGAYGHAFIAQFGDFAPDTSKVMGPVGFKVVRVNPETGEVEDFMVNKGRENGPASRIGGGGLERPIAARFNPEGTALYVVDFGVLTMEQSSHHPRRSTGAVWRVVREEGR